MGYNVRIGKSEHASKRMQMLAAAAGSDACERRQRVRKTVGFSDPFAVGVKS